MSSSPASPYKLTPASAHMVRHPFGCWCDHQKCLTLCLWHALLITGVPGLKRFFEKRLAAAIGWSKLSSKDRVSPGTSMISSKNCEGAVESVLLQTLRRSGYRPAKSGEKQTQISLYTCETAGKALCHSRHMYYSYKNNTAVVYCKTGRMALCLFWLKNDIWLKKNNPILFQ